MSTSTKQKKKHIKAVRPKLRLFRANEPLYSVLMWGINHSISELNHVNLPVMLMPDDFKAFTKIRVDNHMFNKDNMPSHFKFKEYCPVVFRNLRERFGVDEEVYLNSLTKYCPAEAQPLGRGGMRKLFSYDSRFFIRCIQTEHVAEMHRVLKEYHQYIVERHAKTLLPQYLGMYRVTINDSETYVVVMRNIFSPRLPIQRKYDLKGSTVARQASEKERAKDLPTFKDNDFLNDGQLIRVGPEKREQLMAMIQSDTEFLASLNLMDYSLLVGIHDCDVAAANGAGDQRNNSFDNDLDDTAEGEGDEGDDDDSPGSGGGGAAGGGELTPPDSPVVIEQAPFFNGELDQSLEFYATKCSEVCQPPRNEIYFLAIVDILTHYGVKKRTAQAAKTVKHGAGAEISTVKPDQYAKRFMEFVEKIIE